MNVPVLCVVGMVWNIVSSLENMMHFCHNRVLRKTHMTNWNQVKKANGGYYINRSVIIGSNFSLFAVFWPQNSCLHGFPSVCRGYPVFLPCMHCQLVHKPHVKFPNVLYATWCRKWQVHILHLHHLCPASVLIFSITARCILSDVWQVFSVSSVNGIVKYLIWNS